MNITSQCTSAIKTPVRTCSSGEFNIHHEPELARAFVAYATMDDNAMGLDVSIEWKNSHRYITVEDGNGDEKRLELNGLLVRQRAVVCRGTTRQAIGSADGKSDGTIEV